MSRRKPFFVGNKRTGRYHLGAGTSACHVLEMELTHEFYDSLAEIREANRMRKKKLSICYHCYREKEKQHDQN